MERGGYARLDADYLMHVRPHLTDREARVYEAVVLLCDGWDRPMATASVATITRLHVDHVRKAMRSLDALKLIGCTWRGSPNSPSAQRSIVILRDYAAVVRGLGALGRIGPVLQEAESEGGPSGPSSIGREPGAAMGRNSPELPPRSSPTNRKTQGQIGPELSGAVGQIGPESTEGLGRNGPKTMGRNSPETVGQIGPGHLIARSLPDPSIPPSQPEVPPEPPHADIGGGKDGDRVGQIPSELVELCRELWKPTEVPIKAARRYVAKLLPVGMPIASAGEIASYLRMVAKSHRVQTARCPIAVACMPEEFAAWLERRRIAHAAQAQRLPAEPPSESLSRREIGRRAEAFSLQLARCLPDEGRLHESAKRDVEIQPEIKSNVGT